MGVLKHFASLGIETFIKILNYNFMINWFKYFDKKSDNFYV